MAVLLAFLSSAVAAKSAEPAPRPVAAELPAFAQIERLVKAHLVKTPDYRPGDLLSQSDVTPLFGTLAKIGFPVTDAKEILADLLPDDHFLVKQLRTERGRKFMRGVSGYPLAYDQMERLGDLRGGQQFIHDVIRLPDGTDYFRPDFSRLSSLAELLPKDRTGRPPRGVDFDKPTGRIYTEAALIDRLRRSYDAALKTRDEAGEEIRQN